MRKPFLHLKKSFLYHTNVFFFPLKTFERMSFKRNAFLPTNIWYTSYILSSFSVYLKFININFRILNFDLFIFTEMQWLSVDFHEEHQWKIAAAKMLAHSAKKYVEQQADRKAKKAAMLEKKHRRIAKFMADQVDLFWQSIFR